MALLCPCTEQMERSCSSPHDIIDDETIRISSPFFVSDLSSVFLSLPANILDLDLNLHLDCCASKPSIDGNPFPAFQVSPTSHLLGFHDFETSSPPHPLNPGYSVLQSITGFRSSLTLLRTLLRPPYTCYPLYTRFSDSRSEPLSLQSIYL